MRLWPRREQKRRDRCNVHMHVMREKKRCRQGPCPRWVDANETETCVAIRWRGPSTNRASGPRRIQSNARRKHSLSLSEYGREQGFNVSILMIESPVAKLEVVNNKR